MKRLLSVAAAALSAVTMMGVAGSAQAALTLRADNLNCDVFGATGCVFDLDNGDGSAVFDNPLAYEAAYAAQHQEPAPPPTIDLGDYLGKTDGVTTSLQINLPVNYLVNFYSVKSSTSVILFGLSTPTNSFLAVYNGIRNRNGVLQDISHVTYYGSVCTDNCGGGGGTGGAVPEPATWAMMIMGFGGVGSLMRRRRSAIA